MNLAEFMELQRNGMRQLSIKQTTAFDQTDARKLLFVYLAKATDKSSFTNYLNKRLETVADDWKLPYLEQVKIHSEKAQRENKGLTATQTQWFDDYLQGFNARRQPTAQPSEQATPPAVQPDADSDTTTEPSGIDTEALKALFLPVFFAPDFKQLDTLNGAINLSRFDIFVEQLESLLSDAQCDKKKIGNVAYMVHKSKFRKRNFRKFAPLCRLLFECCPIEAPKDQRPNKYSQPDNDTLERFSDALGNPLNPQK